LLLFAWDMTNSQKLFSLFL